MRIIETDTNDSGQPTFLLEKGNTTGTLIVATRTGPAKIRFRYLLTDRQLTARDSVAAWRAVTDYERTHHQPEPGTEIECCAGTWVPYPTNGNDTECPVCHSVFTLTTAGTE